MKAKNLLVAVMTVWLLSLGSIAFGDDDLSMETNVSQESVNINTASAELLAESLNGIGLRRAEAIVAYRENFGPFYSAEELTAVKGIGQGTIERNSARIVID